MKQTELKDIRNILIIRPDAIGDCVLITPAIAALRQRFPRAKITVLAQQLTRDVFDVDEVITDNNEIKPGKFDLSIHYFNELPYALAARKAGIKYRLGDPSKFPVGLLYNLKYRQNWRDITKHDVEQNLLLLKLLNIEPPYPGLDLKVDPQALAKIEVLLKENGVRPTDKIAGLHLSTGKGNKPWNPANFGLIALYLWNRGFKVVAAGTQKDHELIQQAQKIAQGKIIDLSLKTDLKGLIALTSKYNVFIGVDTGPFHIAAALGIPIVHISTSKFALPLRWGPWQDRHILVRKHSLCDRFCLPANCRETDCADEISTDDVKLAIDTLLSGGGNLNQEEAFFDWCKKSFSVMIAHNTKGLERAKEIYITLHRAGFYAILVDIAKRPDYQSLFKSHNANILHVVNGSPWLRLQALISGRSLITPVLYVKDRPELKSFEAIFKDYCRSFEQSKV
ncbi:MAG: glycosyltransferase family 9 protein [Candidatus Saganbacteria bacterium]|nr:glycosyltransferase family 9 protein [Candidatus Saganbacteria bacterium]